MSNGKGDRNRPLGIDFKTWSQNYERIFGDQEQNDQENNTENEEE